jgi:hypothetical protein
MLLDPALTAVTVTVAPVVMPLMSMLGVTSLVKLSVPLVPESDAVFRSGAERATRPIAAVAGDVETAVFVIELVVFVPVATKRIK